MAKFTYALYDYRAHYGNGKTPHWRGTATAQIRGGMSVRVGADISGTKGWPSRAALKSDIDAQLKRLGLIK